jgi:hypothetical protein
MSPARIYVIVTNENDEQTYFYRNRNDVLEFLIDYLHRPQLKMTTVDNYIQIKNTLPPSLKSVESFDLYNFLSDEFKIMYGNTFDNKSAKTIQRRYFQLFDDTISSKTDVFI